MDANGNYTVSNVVIRQAPQLGPTGTVSQATVVSFSVGPHGPFTLTWPTTPPAPADIVAAITARVDEIRGLDTALAQLNQRP